jgi:signal transduction histidine kinase
MMENEPASRQLTIGAAEHDGTAIMFSIRDTGPKTSVENPDSLFDPFYTTKPDGLGLGLSVCRTIVEGHGGQIRFFPEAEVGSVVNFTLPVSKQGDRNDT